jgi:DNA-binding NarL/FixJ family response regulator
VPGRQAVAGYADSIGQPLRIVIAEDSVLLRAGLTRLLTDAGEEVIAAVGDGGALLEAIELHQPDLAVVDVRMPPTQTDEGLRAALVIRRRWPDVGILVLSQYVEERYAAELLAGNTCKVGYLLKDRVADVAEFLASVRRVGAGGTALDAEVVAQLLARSRRRDPLDGLSRREREVLGLMAEGLNNAAIGETLVISDGAVEKHVTNIFTKLGLSAADQGHRRVLAVLTWLEGSSPPGDGRT